MRKTSTAVRMAGAAMMALAVVPWIGGGNAAAVARADADIFVKDSQVPTTASAFTSKQTDCPGFVASEPFDYFHFVLDGNDHVFVELTAEFSTGNVTVFPNDKHAYVKAPAGATLNDAYATVSPDSDVPSDFQLSHVCVGTVSTSTSSASTSTSVVTTSSAPITTPATIPATTASTSAPVTSTTSAAVTSTTSAPAASQTTVETSVLPTKIGNSDDTAGGGQESEDVEVEGTKAGTEVESGVLAATGSRTPLGLTLAISLALLLGGAAMLFVPRRLAVERGAHHRRH